LPRANWPTIGISRLTRLPLGRFANFSYLMHLFSPVVCLMRCGIFGACIGIPAAIYLFAQMPGKFSTVWVWKCHSDFGIRDASMGPGIEGRSIL
jgi:hypothetical protein